MRETSTCAQKQMYSCGSNRKFNKNEARAACEVLLTEAVTQNVLTSRRPHTYLVQSKKKERTDLLAQNGNPGVELKVQGDMLMIEALFFAG